VHPGGRLTLVVAPVEPFAAAGPPGPTVGLYLRADGTWLHDGQEVTHARLSALLHHSIAVDPAGGWMVTTGRDRLPFACEDTPLRVLAATIQPEDVVALTFSNGQSQPLVVASLTVDPDASWRCVSREGLPARFTRAAVLSLAHAVDEQGGMYVLRLGGLTVPLGASPG